MKTSKCIFIFIGLIIFFLYSCKKDDDLKPQLEITVIDNMQKQVSGATVLLYTDQQNWENKSNPFRTGITNSQGIIKFTELDEVNYYIRAENGLLNNNFNECYLNESLKKGQLVKVTVTIK